MSAVALLTGSLLGCCGDDVRSVSMSIGPHGKLDDVGMWIGDTATAYASAKGMPQLFCSLELCNSWVAPDRFQFSSTDVAVATIDSRGRVTARGRGFVKLVAASAGFSDTQRIYVSPPFAALRITITSKTSRIGDTVLVRADIWDALGHAVPGAQVNGFRAWPDTQVSWVLKSDLLPFYPPRPAPMMDRLVPRSPGRTAIVAYASRYRRHDAPDVDQYFVTDSVTLNVQH